MPKRKTKVPAEVHVHLGLRIQGFNARVDSSLNWEIHDKRMRHDGTPVYRFHTYIEMTGECVYPGERVGEKYEISIYGDERDVQGFGATLDDFHVREEFGPRKYEKVRGKSEPVYDLPKSIGYLNKIRGQSKWQAVAFLPSQTVSDMLILLPHIRPLYLVIHEIKEGRNRRIWGLTLQTIHPELE